MLAGFIPGKGITGGMRIVANYPILNQGCLTVRHFHIIPHALLTGVWTDADDHQNPPPPPLFSGTPQHPSRIVVGLKTRHPNERYCTPHCEIIYWAIENDYIFQGIAFRPVQINKHIYCGFTFFYCPLLILYIFSRKFSDIWGDKKSMSINIHNMS